MLLALLRSGSRPDARSGLRREAFFRPILPALVLAGAFVTLPLAARSAELDLTVDNVKPGGALRIAVYGSAADYRKTAVKELQVPASGNPVSVRIALDPGDYAIALYHDRNGNGTLDSNLLGIPTEPYGFSGNARNLMGPATWEQAKFGLAAGGGAVMVKLSD